MNNKAFYEIISPKALWIIQRYKPDITEQDIENIFIDVFWKHLENRKKQYPELQEQDILPKSIHQYVAKYMYTREITSALSDYVIKTVSNNIDTTASHGDAMWILTDDQILEAISTLPDAERVIYNASVIDQITIENTPPGLNSRKIELILQSAKKNIRNQITTILQSQ